MLPNCILNKDLSGFGFSVTVVRDGHIEYFIMDK